jgi:hypothetical protein
MTQVEQLEKVEDKIKSMIEEVATEQPDGQEIRSEVLERINGDERLRERFIPIAMRVAIDKWRYQIQSKMRTAAEHNCRGQRASMRAESTKIYKEFWIGYTVLGQCLKDVDRETLEVSVNIKERQAEGKMRRAEFERKILSKMEDGQVVSDAWTLEEIEELSCEYLDE